MSSEPEAGGLVSEVLLDMVYAAVTVEDALGPMLARLALDFGCISGALVYVDSGRPAADVALSHGIFGEPELARYRAEFAHIDPAPTAFAALPIGQAAATDRLFSPAERATSRFLADFYFPLGLRETLGAPIVQQGSQLGIVAVHRGPERPPFGDAEIARFGEIASHLARAMALRARFFAVAHTARARGDMLDGVAAGLMTFDAAGRLLDANATARAILARGDGLILSRAGRLEAADRAADAELQAAFAGPVRDAPFVLAVPRAGGRSPYVLKVSRPDPGASVAGFAVHVTDAEPPSADAEDALARALGLPRPSARLTAALLRGDDLKSYAAKAGITLNTAKFHLKAAFKATGAHRQADLVRIATTVLRDLAI